MAFFPRGILAGATLLGCALASQAFAADRSSASVGGTRVDSGAVQARRAALIASRKTTAALPNAAAPAGTSTPAELTASSYRAYPSSCFSDTLPSSPGLIQPLPVAPSGPLYSRTVTLYEKDGTQDSSEDVTITVWRVACSSSRDQLSYNPDKGYVGATLMRIQRQSAYEGDSQLYPQFPDIRIAQGNIVFDNVNFTDYVRVAAEPNTVVSDTMVGAPVINSTTYVLEDYPNPSLGFFYFNNAFTIRFDNGYQNGRVTLDVPDYVPTQQSYPAAFQPMPISGYMTGSWYTPGHGGEGMLTQVFDKSDGLTRTFFAAWYTFDTLGLPFWLTAQADFPIGTTQLTGVPVYYVTGGGFAGNYTSPTSTKWGTVNIRFSDCQNIHVDYKGSTGSVSGGPSGEGSIDWKRLIGNASGINSLACQ